MEEFHINQLFCFVATHGQLKFQSSDLNESVNGKMKVLEDLTSNAKQIQDDLLEDILACNANTEYLQRFLHGSSDKELFKKNIPIVTYKDVQPFIERVANGEPSDVISAQPITGFTFRYKFFSCIFRQF